MDCTIDLIEGVYFDYIKGMPPSDVCTKYKISIEEFTEIIKGIVRKSYERGRADAVEEFAKSVNHMLSTYGNFISKEEIMRIAKYLKEQK